jgi:nicotinamidase/pyrazinamidase
MGGPWPVHCVAGEFGAEFPVELLLPEDTIIISKAEQPDKDAYSAFDDTCLNNQLEQRGIRRLFIGGLATDYCVLHTVKDALVLGYEAVLLEDAVCAVNQQAGDGDKAKVKMTSLGAVEITLKHIAQ